MAKAKKLPSGKYRIQYYIDGVKYSATADTAKEAEYIALQHRVKNKVETSSRKTFGKAIEDYIEMKSNILSPSTITGYHQLRRNAYPNLINLPMSKITTQAVQKQMNINAGKYSAKSVRNQYGLLSAVLLNEGKDIGQIALKPKEKLEYHIPTQDEMKQIIKAVEGRGDLEIYVLFVMLLGLRPSEAIALTWKNYDGERILVKGSRVLDVENNMVWKSTNKTYDSTRLLDVPELLREKLSTYPRDGEFILRRTGSAYNKAFTNLLRSAGLPHFRIYDLRHAFASVMLTLGIPDKYAMERMGHSTPNMLKTVYQHTFKSEQDSFSEKLNDYWDRQK